MKIEEVFEKILCSVFQIKSVAKNMALKGGGALIQLGIDTRKSLDLDFSLSEKLDDPDNFKEALIESLNRNFKSDGFEAIDIKIVQKPKKRTDKHPDTWGGWQFVFKLSEIHSQSLTPEQRSQQAFVPEGAQSSKLELDLSEHEYIGSTEVVKLKGTDLKVYTRPLLALEKIRAICQQHERYPYTGFKDRGRDFIDIYNIEKSVNGSDEFYEAIRKDLESVFKAKNVPLELIDEIFDDGFTNKFTDKGIQIYGDKDSGLDMKAYVESVREIIKKIRAKNP